MPETEKLSSDVTSVVLIETTAGEHAGMGIYIGNNTVLTCAHVVAPAVGHDEESGTRPKEPVSVMFHNSAHAEPFTAHVREQGWFPVSDGYMSDVAILQLDGDAPSDVDAMRLQNPIDYYGVDAVVYGKGVEDEKVLADPRVTIDGEVACARGQLNGRQRGSIQFDQLDHYGVEVEKGFSGAGLYCPQLGAAVGMVAVKIEQGGMRVAFVISADLLRDALKRCGFIVARSTPKGPVEEQWQNLMSDTREGRLTVVIGPELSDSVFSEAKICRDLGGYHELKSDTKNVHEMLRYISWLPGVNSAASITSCFLHQASNFLGETDGPFQVRDFNVRDGWTEEAFAKAYGRALSRCVNERLKIQTSLQLFQEAFADVTTFVSTCIDGFIFEAIRMASGAGVEPDVRSLAQTSRYEQQSPKIFFQMFGGLYPLSDRNELLVRLRQEEIFYTLQSAEMSGSDHVPTRLLDALRKDSILFLGFSISDWRLPLALSLVERAARLRESSGRDPANIVVQIAPDELSASIPSSGFTAIRQRYFALEQPLEDFAEVFIERYNA